VVLSANFRESSVHVIGTVIFTVSAEDPACQYFTYGS
jgi:hypothetical protein